MVTIIIALWVTGARNFYFHQDDVISLSMVARDWPRVLVSPNAEHVNSIFFTLLYSEWKLFGLNYPWYLAVSMMIWSGILGFVYKIVKQGTKSSWWGVIAVGALAINRNWGEMVWWVTGQAMMSATLLMLASWWYRLKLDKEKRVKWWESALWGISLILPGLAWGGGLIWPFVALLFWRKANVSWIASTATLAIYLAVAGSSSGLHFSSSSWIDSPLQIILFVAVGLIENVLGRWIFPFRNLAVQQVVLIGALLSWIKWGRAQFKMNRQVIFAWSVSILSLFAYALPRWQFGLGQAMAERYAFAPLIFGVIGITIGLRKLKLTTRRVVIIFGLTIYLMVVGSIGFAKKAESWRERPLQVKEWFEELNSLAPGQCYPSEYLPDFVVEPDLYITEDIWPIFKKNFEPWRACPD